MNPADRSSQPLVPGRAACSISHFSMGFDSSLFSKHFGAPSSVCQSAGEPGGGTPYGISVDFLVLSPLPSKSRPICLCLTLQPAPKGAFIPEDQVQGTFLLAGPPGRDFLGTHFASCLAQGKSNAANNSRRTLQL